MQTLVNALANYLGHRNILPQNLYDRMLLKALELGKPESMLEVLRLHRELMYHPSTTVLKAYSEYFTTQPIDKLKLFYTTAIKNNFYLQVPSTLHSQLINAAFEAKDFKLARDVYMNILDYEKAGLTTEHIKKVFESLDYALCIDHGLVEHLGMTGSRLGLLKDASVKAH